MEGLNERPSRETYEQDVEHFRKKGRQEGIDKLFLEHDLNLLAFSADSLVFAYASAAGYPIATMPLGILHHKGRPFGLGLIAQAGREDLMFQFMSAYEANFPPRSIPNALLLAKDLNLPTYLPQLTPTDQKQWPPETLIDEHLIGNMRKEQTTPLQSHHRVIEALRKARERKNRMLSMTCLKRHIITRVKELKGGNLYIQNIDTITRPCPPIAI
ncbi:MAG: hypothetical protein Q9190_006184 [Brigantiaea leucoxantha]